MELFRLDGKTALVTGGTGLYGKPITEALAGAGANVIVTSREVQKCETYAAGLRQKGYAVEGVTLDLSNDASIDDCVHRVTDRFGGADILINNAVSREGIKDLEALTRSDLMKAVSVNYAGILLLTRAVITGMRERRNGSIINIGSIQGAVGPHFPVYDGTGMTSGVNYTFEKWGMVGFTKWLANYYGKFGIRANCISPGGFGPGVRDAYGENAFVTRYKQLTPLGRFAEEDDIKGPVIFLASNASAYVTGQNILVDGGWTSW